MGEGIPGRCFNLCFYGCVCVHAHLVVFFQNLNSRVFFHHLLFCARACTSVNLCFCGCVCVHAHLMVFFQNLNSRVFFHHLLSCARACRSVRSLCEQNSMKGQRGDSISTPLSDRSKLTVITVCEHLCVYNWKREISRVPQYITM